MSRIDDLLDAGVKSCWYVQPATESIAIFAGDDQPTTVATGTLDDPTTDIEVDLAEITDGKLPPLTGYRTRSDQRFCHGNDEGASQHLH